MKQVNPELEGNLIVKVEILVYDDDEILSSSQIVPPGEVVQGLEVCARSVLELWKGEEGKEVEE